ncbi:MAG: DNA polymerase III subunit alpha [Planctomycetota bacterium]|nr:MAG: DNA polymerase III subunit alpha [Planctomycetota bacterium]
MAAFTHLHCHSHFTLLESTSTITGLVQRACELEMDALALTDRGNLLGAYEFSEATKKAGITGIIGCQVNIAPLGMAEKSRDMHNLVLLAMNPQGYTNLMQLVSLGWLHGFHYEPRVDLECLAQHHEGIICLTGAGPDGFLNRHLQAGVMDEAVRQAGLLQDIFSDRLYVELTDHGVDGPVSLRDANRDLARRCSLPVVASNWCHYLQRDDAAAHDVQLAIQKVTTLSDTRRRRMPSQEFFFKSADEMAELFADCPEALAATREITERCRESGIPYEGYHLPLFTCPHEHTTNSYLKAMCHDGLQERYGDDITDEHLQRLQFELETIENMGFEAYFLIVQDFINWAKANDIPVGPGRGSAAGSLVAYCLGITDICPLRYGLLFERFLNPGRKSMPDIDIDFCKDGRQRVIDYVSDKYGSQAVTMIMTLGTMKARMAIKDVARAYEWTPAESQDLANLVPEDPGGKHTIPVCLGLKPLKDGEDATVESMRLRYENDERTRVVLDTAMRLENLGRSLGVHACGVIIAPGPVHHYVPVCTVKQKPATQYNMSQVESCGLLKMDFLGLKTMSILKKAADIALATQSTTTPILYPDLPMDDTRTFELLGEGDTLGVFQCESSGFQELIRLLQPDRFEDMIALVALYRPGPLMANMHIQYCDRKHGREQVDYPHPVLEEVLEETFGLFIYQEQVMNISRELCGFTPSQADDLRKAMGKKVADVMAKMKDMFIEGAWERHQFDRRLAEQMWDKIVGFASYCFNKSHSACYGQIAYWTAYMKANHYPAFMTANLIYEMGNKDKMSLFVQELRRKGYEVLPPDINRSGWEFTPDGDAILYGFGGIKGVGHAAAEHIMEVREISGSFGSLYDFCERISTRTVNKRVVDALIRVGAFDALHSNRRALLETMDRAFDRGQRIARSREQQQATLFDVFEEDPEFKADTQGYPDIPDFSEHERLDFEKQLTGYWMSSHPLSSYQDSLKPHTSHVATDLRQRPSGEIAIAAVVISKRTIKTRTNKMMAVLTLEDLSGRFEAVLFAGRSNRRGDYEAGPYDRFAADCDDNLVAIFRGKVDERQRRRQAPPAPTLAEEGDEIDPAAAMESEQTQEDDIPSLIVSDVIPADILQERLTREIILTVDEQLGLDAVLPATESLLKEHPGACPLMIHVHTPDQVLVKLSADERWHIHPSKDLIQGLQKIWGARHVHPIFARPDTDMRA